MSASPYLEQIHSEWQQRIGGLPQEAAFQREVVSAVTLALQENRRMRRQQREHDLRELERFLDELEARWKERIQRISAWKEAAQSLDGESAALRDLVESLDWFRRAYGVRGTLVRRQLAVVHDLQERQRVVRERLESWRLVLADGRARMAEFRARQETSERPRLVSRARKRLDLDYVSLQDHTAQELAGEVAALRRSFNRALERLRKAYRAVDARAAAHPTLFQVQRNELLSGLKDVEHRMTALREPIMADALRLEGCRTELSEISREVAEMRVLEEAYRPRAPFWRRLLDSLDD